MKDYSTLRDLEKTKLLHEHYIEEKKSIQQIAEIYGVYPNKIRRDLKKHNIAIRSKSEAQKNALETGVHKHPTKGVPRDEETKQKIGLSVMKQWDNMSTAELNRRKQIAKNMWDNLPEDEKQLRNAKANQAIRESSKTGSKLEKFLFTALLKNGYRVEPHKEQILSNTKLHIDLFLSEVNIAVEIDGPSHFEPVWGEKALERAQDYDNKKTGLLIGKGFKLIRVKQTRDFSKSRAKIIFVRLMEAIADIRNQGKNYIEIGDE